MGPIFLKARGAKVSFIFKSRPMLPLTWAGGGGVVLLHSDLGPSETNTSHFLHQVV